MVVVGIASIIAVLVLWAWQMLSFAFFVVPLSGLFYFADAKTLADWRSQVLAVWSRGEIDISALNTALRAHPKLPKATLEGMLATLPATGELVAEHRVSLKTREAVTALAVALYSFRADQLALKMSGVTLVVLAVIGSAVLEGWYPLLLLMAVFIIPLLTLLSRKIRLRDAQVKIQAAQLDPCFDSLAFNRIAAGLDWGSIADTARNKFIVPDISATDPRIEC